MQEHGKYKVSVSLKSKRRKKVLVREYLAFGIRNEVEAEASKMYPNHIITLSECV
mgnify:CR=1 FL=1|jgi:hypothetical protein